MKAVLFLPLLGVWAVNCFAVVPNPAGDKPIKRAALLAAQLKAAAKSFRLDLNYHGDQDKPYHRLTLSVPVVPQLAIDPFHPVVQITEEEAVKIIEHLKLEGFLEQAQDKPMAKIVGNQSCYLLTVRSVFNAERTELSENLGWGLPMLKRLNGIKAVAPVAANRAMDLMLDRLEGHRKEWINAGAKKGDNPEKIRVLFSEKTVQPERDVPREARKARPGPEMKPGAFSKLAAGNISSLTVTYFNPKALKGKKETEEFLRRLLTTPKGSTCNQIRWAQSLDFPTIAANVEHRQGKLGTWLVWDGGQSVYCAYKDGAGRWWFGVWFQDEIPR